MGCCDWFVLEGDGVVAGLLGDVIPGAGCRGEGSDALEIGLGGGIGCCNCCNSGDILAGETLF